MNYKKSYLTQFSKDCANGSKLMIQGICLADEIVHSNIGQEFRNGIETDLLISISKRYAKYMNDHMCFDIDVGEMQDFQQMISKIVDCCEKNNWFQ